MTDFAGFANGKYQSVARSDGQGRPTFRSIFELAGRWWRYAPRIRRRQHLKKQKGCKGGHSSFQKLVADRHMGANGICEGAPGVSGSSAVMPSF
jgi:hypothetical protein